MVSNSNRTECSPIRSVIIRVITKADNRVGESYLFITSVITDRILDDKKITISEKKRKVKL